MSASVQAVPVKIGWLRSWPRWAPYAAVGWSLVYGAVGMYWALNRSGFPYAPENMPAELGPLLGRFGEVTAWTVVVLAGIPAALMGIAMLRGVRGRLLRPLLITAAALLAGVLLVCIADLTLLQTLGYVPYGLIGIITGGAFGQRFLDMLGSVKWTIAYQLFGIAGGFLWLASAVSYARRSGEACLYCGRSEKIEVWNSPERAKRWGRIAVYIAMAVPVIYAVTRFAWALGIPLGMTEEYWRQGQEGGIWIGGLSLATFGLVGAVLMLGLVQRWGEVFPRWIPGLGGKRVPIALAVVPAAIVSVVLVVGGIAIWTSLGQMMANIAATGASQSEITGALIFQVGPTLLFPVWGAALAIGTLGYYYRRRGPCDICGRGMQGNSDEPAVR